MKKVVFSVLAAFGMLSASAQAVNEFVVKPANVTSGSTATLDLVMVNDFQVSGLQFNVLLPKGITIAKNNKNKMAKGTSFSWVDRGDEISWTETFSFKAVGEDEQVNFAIGVGDDYILEGTGTVMQLSVKVDPSMEAGVYPVYVKCTKCSDLADEHAISDQYTSYVVVNGGKGELVAKNVIPATVNEVLASESAISKLDLSAVTASYGDFAYVDGREVVGSTATASVKYEGNNSNYYSVNVPFAGDVTGDVYELESVSSEFASFKTATSVEANKTYLAKGAVTVSAASATVAGVATKTNVTGSYVKDGQFWHGSNLTVKPMRGLFEVPAGSNLRIVVDGELTGITTAQVEAGEASYDLQGRQVQNAKNGVFVVNGKKQFVK